MLTHYLHQCIGHPDRKMNKETMALNKTLDQRDLTIYTEHSTPKEQNTYSRACGTFSWIGHKTNLNMFKKTSYQVSFLIRAVRNQLEGKNWKEKNWKKQKHMQAK